MKKQTWILLAVAVALALFLVFRDRLSFGGGLSWKAWKGAPESLVLVKAGKTTEFAKADGRWVMGPNRYQADPEKVKKLVEVLSTNRSFQLVTPYPFYEKYSLEPTNRVEATLATGKDKRTLLIGKAAPTYSHTFVMIAGDSNIYQTEGYFSYDFTQDLEQFRDKTMFAFTADDAVALEVRDEAGRVLSLKKVAEAFTTNTNAAMGQPPRKVWKTAESGKDANNTEAGDLVANLARLTATAFAAESNATWAQAVKKPIAWQGVAKTASKTYSLTILKEKIGADYQAVVNDRNEVFLLNEDTAKRVMIALDKLK
ncbi:MAG: DUF4340 domain-containing protein [Spirochaetes bacterium]|nr:DUF4340 domain-containing protein [Spirochaetota bacterium]